MCAAKSPITELQEFALKQHLLFPHYEITPQAAGFRCTANFAKISENAVASSKKMAKHLCAECILQQLSNSKEHAKKVPDKSAPTFNAVGKLNQMCSQNGIGYPNYEEAGIEGQKYITRCKLLSQITQGQASTKKAAKQMAAMEMLSRVMSSKYDNLIIEEHLLKKAKPKPKHNTEAQRKIIELFKQVSFKTRTKHNEEKTLQTSVDLHPDVKKEESEGRSEEEKEVSEEELREALKGLDVDYQILELQKSPLVLILKTVPTKNHPAYTFMHADDIYDLAVLGLLKKAVRDMKLMRT